MSYNPEDIVIKKSLLPGFLFQQHRRHLAIEDPLEAGWVVLKRKWYWVGLREWMSLNVYARFHMSMPNEEWLVPDRAVTNIERQSRLALVVSSLRELEQV